MENPMQIDTMLPTVPVKKMERNKKILSKIKDIYKEK